MFRILVSLLIRLYPSDFQKTKGRDLADFVVFSVSEKGRTKGPLSGTIQALRELVSLIRGSIDERLRVRNLRSVEASKILGGWLQIVGSIPADVRYALRDAFQRPIHSAIVVITLAVGIGINAAIFSVVNSVLLRPLDYESPEELVIISTWISSAAVTALYPNPPQVRELRSQPEVFESVAVASTVSGRILGGDRPIHTDVARASSNFFEVLGVEPLLGRTFAEGEDLPGADRVTILTYEFWKENFAGDPNIVGDSIRFGYHPMQVIGVLPESFDFRIQQLAGDPTKVDLWIPYQLDYSDPQRSQGFDLRAVARLADDVDGRDAEAWLNQLSETEDRTFFEGGGFRFEMTNLQKAQAESVRSSLMLLLAAAGFVLLIIVANLTTLIVGRTEYRKNELAVRHALGGSRFRIARQLVLENLTVTLTGGMIALLISTKGAGLLVNLFPKHLPGASQIAVDWRIAGFTVLIAIIAGVFSGLFTVIGTHDRWNRRTLIARVGSPRGNRAQDLLVVAQFALSLLLLSGASLMVRSSIQLQEVTPGFNPIGLIAFDTPLMEEYDSPEIQDAFLVALTERLGRLPEIVDASSVSPPPLSRPLSLDAALVELDGDTATTGLTDENRVSVTVMSAQSGYFGFLGASLLAGREFISSTDSPTGEPVIIIDKLMAQRFWNQPDEAIHRKFRIMGEWRTVVGVVDHTRLGEIHKDGVPRVFLPNSQTWNGETAVVARLNGTASFEEVRTAILREVAAIDPLVPIADLRRLGDVVEKKLAERTFSTTLMTGSALTAILIAALGIYAVLAYSLGRRRREIAIRIAVGSSRSETFRVVIGHGAKLALIGTSIGLVGGLILGQLLEEWLYQTDPTDPLPFVLAGVLGLTVAILACLTPAYRATAVDPATMLRQD